MLSVLVDEPNDTPNTALAKLGYLGTAPRNPGLAIGFQVLEAYRQLHRVCPKLSIYGQVKALCHLHKVCLTATTIVVGILCLHVLVSNHSAVPLSRNFP